MIDASKYSPSFKTACVALKGEAYCTPKVVQGLMAVSRHETCFSECKPFIGAYNFGAIQCGTIADKAGKCPGGCIPARDTSPTASGGNIAYLGCFRAKPSAEEGIADFVRLMVVQRPLIAEALPSGDARQIAWAMRKSYYFEGFGKTQEERVENYAIAIERNARTNAAQLRAEQLVTLPPLEEEGIGTVDLAAGSTAAGLLIAALLKRITKGSDK